jgi:nicotinamidase-related amidase
MMTSMGVDAPVRAAFDLGFACTVAKDGCATRDQILDGETVPARQVQVAFLSPLSAVYAKVRSTDAIIEGIDACGN